LFVLYTIVAMVSLYANIHFHLTLGFKCTDNKRQKINRTI